MKNCTKCKVLKDETEFSKSCKEKSGFRCRCKSCERDDYRIKNKLKDEDFISLEGELWKDVLGYETLYMISNFGRMYIKPHEITISRNGGNYTMVSNGCFRKLNRGSHPLDFYLKVLLSKNSKVKSEKIHRLVANHFIPNPDNKPHVNHIDANKLNNHYSNLEWCTHQENITHARKSGLYPERMRGEACSFSKLKSEDVLSIRKIGKSMTLKEIAKIYDIHYGTVASIIKRKIWKHI